MDHAVSAIIPIGIHEKEHLKLIEQLRLLTPINEIIIVTSCPNSIDIHNIPPYALDDRVQIIESAPGRAQQLNSGARHASNPYLWFLHADSVIDQKSYSSLVRSLQDSVQKNKDGLFYFNLRFEKPSPFSLLTLNEIGAYARSHLFHLPLGDQGLCVSKRVFERVGRFNEDLKVAEDLNFVLRAKKNGVSIRCTDELITTSPRKYRKEGWLHTTCKHHWITYNVLRDSINEQR